MGSVLRVKGMSCQHCVMSVTKAMSQLDGIQDVTVDLDKGEVRFENTKNLAAERIREAVEKAGYEVLAS
jgi:copper chaperone